MSQAVEGGITTVTFTREIRFRYGGAVADARRSRDVATVTVRWREGTGGAGAGVEKQIHLQGGITRDR